MVKLYHYTDKAGKDAIESSGFILQSKQSSIRDDAVYGDGVYLTSFGPTNTTAALLGNNYDGLKVNMANAPRTEYFFVFSSTDDPAFKEVGKGMNRDIWLLPGKNLTIGKQKATQRTIMHIGVRCDACGCKPIEGIRYKCKSCPDFDLCSGCKAKSLHSHHVFVSTV